MSKILITGASIAGLATAWWLRQSGVDVTVVERAPAFRDGGQNIDVRGVGRDVLRDMGLEADALAHGTGEEGTAWIDDDGGVVAELRNDANDSGVTEGPTAELEILRGDLATLLHERVRGDVEVRYGDAVDAIEDDGADVSVRCTSGRVERFDAVVVAEGVGSSTRELVFPGENEPRWMELTMAYFTIRRAADDDRLWRWHHTTEGRSVSLRPDRHGTTRAILSIRQPPNGEQDWDVAKQKRMLRERFADVGWQAKRVLAGMETTDDFYFDVLRQVRMPRWSAGRVALTGDAAWCATPIAGAGATLAVTGARVLAGELVRCADVMSAFAAYEEKMRPMVAAAQDIPSVAPKLMNPHSRLGLALLHGALSVGTSPGIRELVAKLFARKLEGPDLAQYEQRGIVRS